ncbi:MAG: endonuclease/exonuclease/phosphatase family protein [Bacteroidaceae bacterium]|nr:endonuclease/exonuclease/phosphatase family protein [Bacteroidaceae bacterium]
MKDRADKKNERSVVGKFFTSIFLGANLLSLFLLWACCATTWVNPAFHPRMAVAGLLFPFFLFLNLLFLPFWLLFRPRLLVVPVVGMAICGGYILDYFPVSLSSHGASDEADVVTVMQWNAYDFHSYPRDSVGAGFAYLEESGADIICLQEYGFQNRRYQEYHDSLRARGYNLRQGNVLRCVMTRYPILSCDTVKAETQRHNGSEAYHLLIGGDTVTLVNAHLECYRFSEDDKDEYGSMLNQRSKGKFKQELLFLLQKLSSSSHNRALQTQALADYLDHLPRGRRVILCGDFNETPISYSYQTVSRRLQNVFRRCGRGVGITFREKNFPVRIDHIFCSRDWDCVSVHIDRTMTASDHCPVIAKLKKR